MRCLWASRAFEGVKWVHYKASIGEQNPNASNLSELIKTQPSKKEIIESLNNEKSKELLKLFKIDYIDILRNTIPEEEKEQFNNATLTVIGLLNQGINSSDIYNAIQQAMKEQNKKYVLRQQIKRNQEIGEKIEKLFKELLSNDEHSNIVIERQPWGQDYILSENVDIEELINENNERETINIKDTNEGKVKWYIELKTTGRDMVYMTKLQAETSFKNKNNYALIIVQVDKEIDENTLNDDYISNNAKVISDIGFKIEKIYSEFENFQDEKTKMLESDGDIQIDIIDEQPKFRINSGLWEKEVLSITDFIKRHFT